MNTIFLCPVRKKDLLVGAVNGLYLSRVEIPYSTSISRDLIFAFFEDKTAYTKIVHEIYCMLK